LGPVFKNFQITWFNSNVCIFCVDRLLEIVTGFWCFNCVINLPALNFFSNMVLLQIKNFFFQNSPNFFQTLNILSNSLGFFSDSPISFLCFYLFSQWLTFLVGYLVGPTLFKFCLKFS
jgi:hypothetical protein